MSEVGMILFKTKIQDGLQDYLNDYEGFEDCSIDVRDVQKENGTQPAVIVKKKDGNVAPTIYLRNYYNEFVNSGISLEQILEEMAEAAVDSFRNYPFGNDVENILAKNDGIICELVNTKWNAQMLKNVPHREYEDLSLIYRIKVSAPDMSGTILVTNQLAGYMGMDEQQLYDAAMTGTHADNHYICVSITEILAELMVLEPEELSMPSEMVMYVLTNESRKYGAAALIREDVVNQAMEKLGTDNVIILPSSIHEVIVIPGNMEPDELRKMVMEINDTQVSQNERLSDSVYRYDKKDGLRLIEADRDKEQIREKPDIER